ncbi:MAG: biotin/lipoyl-binding protein [Clostridiales bacterium]|nr:biotin/lipoyl-binding protein [Clostridiales bacterium]MDD7506315.1 biotin/lipoyl-binding protein [Clostridiales bacterium]MDY5677805.1 biotin/lipoyl-containing protein [Eubacteriales bacterium]MDY5726558.1 biotin/lipoyl-containing protein [Eubacteriales bacterium]
MKYKVRLNKKIYEVEVEKGEAILLDEYEAVAPTAAPATPVAVNTAAPVAAQAPVGTAASASAVKSPLPGTVLDVKVSVGQTVKKGDVVMLIEAMKMENEINASKDGKITNVYVAKGAKVEQGSPLFDLA